MKKRTGPVDRFPRGIALNGAIGMMVPFFLVPLLLTLSCNTSHGQMVSNIEIKAASFDPAIKEVFLKNGSKVEGVTVTKSTLSASVSYSGTRGIVFFASEDDLRKGEPEYGRVVLPEEVAKVMLILSPAIVGEVEKGESDEEGSEEKDDGNEVGAVIRAYNMESKGFEAGSYLIYNHSDQKVDLELGDEKGSVEPEGQVILSSEEWKSKATSLAIALSATAEDDKSTRLFSSIWGHRPERRYRVFIELTGRSSRPVLVHSFYEVP
ncbi:hypothetical protein [Haloferula sp.]|uniref:hypothetical protein n=1 Tax=Haloferula sp. TaxID=2497595 RepID=UPI00329E9E41